MKRLLILALFGLLFGGEMRAAEWQPAKGPLMTRWAKDVTPESVRQSPYPRPQLVREAWVNLNGLWDYAIRPVSEPKPAQWDGQILVPFPIESSLSGVMKMVPKDHRVWYRRAFESSTDQAGHVLLHFGAVDWDTTVWVNGQEVGKHRGGYDPFSLDITAALQGKKQHELVVATADPSDAGYQPRGKQVVRPEGIWYTPTTGIWQTVWLEPVPDTYIRSLKIVPDLDRECVDVTVTVARANRGLTIALVPRADAQKLVSVRARANEKITLGIPGPRLWSPDDPFLYDLEVQLLRDGQIVDKVQSYFAMRKIALGPDSRGITRILLNNQPLFQYGPLDQGFWPDGLYAPPTEEALKFDLDVTKKLGFNMIRKHVKVEPDRWYYWCDKMGLLVWQDMPNGDRSPNWDPNGTFNGTEAKRSAESAENYRREWKAIIDALHNHPCIVMWVPFNEAWGQFDTVAVTKWTKQYDPSRLVNCASGGNDFPVGDVIDVHRYPGPYSPQPTSERAAVLGEFGGLGLPLAGHTWQDQKNWGYKSFKTKDELTEAYLQLVQGLRPLIRDPGCSAAVYTQTTDVEIEVNGLLTYDRTVTKIDAERVAAANRKLYLPPPIVKPLLATSQKAAATWRSTTSPPAANWFESAFDDSAWREAPGGFGEKSTPGSVVGTEWKSPDIWLRRSFDLPSDFQRGNVQLLMHHDEDVEVHVNGQLVAKLNGYTTEYTLHPLPAAAQAAFQPGRNVIAVHCHQTGGGQYIDVGLVDVLEQAK